MTTPEAMNWDDAYQDKVFEAPPPWNIGEPQPDLAALIDAGKVHGEVLDAGCGVAELALTLAARGHTVVGIDNAPTALDAARKAAEQRGLTTVTFVRDDITKFSGYDGRFATVFDSTLFHSLPVEDRDAYLTAIHRAAAPGANLYMLVFAKGAFPEAFPIKPNEVSEEELRAAVSEYFEIDDVRPAFVHGNMPPVPDSPFASYEHDEKGRAKLPAFLLSAHKAE
jgi:SAM-dependent methyltransferase